MNNLHWFFLQVIYILRVPFPDVVVMSLNRLFQVFNYVSGIPNLAKSSCKNLIVPLHVGFLYFITSGHFKKQSTTINNIVPSLDLQNLYRASTKVCLSLAKE